MRKAAWIKRLAILLVISMVMADLSVPVYASSTTVPAEQVELIDEAEIQQTATEGEATVEEPVAEEPVVVEEDAVTEAPVPAVSANEVEETEPEVTEKEVDAVKADPENAIALELDVLYNMSENEAGYYAFTPEESGYYASYIQYGSKSGETMNWYDEAANKEVKPVTVTNYNHTSTTCDHYTVYYLTAGVKYLGEINSDATEDSQVKMVAAQSFDADNTCITGDYVTAIAYTPSKTGVYTIRTGNNEANVYKTDGKQVYSIYEVGNIAENAYASYYLEKDCEYLVHVYNFTGVGTDVATIESATQLTLNKKATWASDGIHLYTYTPSTTGFYALEAQNVMDVSDARFVGDDSWGYVSRIVANLDENWNEESLDWTYNSFELFYLEEGVCYCFNVGTRDNSQDSTIKLSMFDTGTLKAGKEITVDDYWIGKVAVTEAGLYNFSAVKQYNGGGEIKWFSISGEVNTSDYLSPYEENAFYLDEEYLADDVYVFLKGEFTTTFSKPTVTELICNSTTPYQVTSDKAALVSFTATKDGLYSLYGRGDYYAMQIEAIETNGMASDSSVVTDFMDGYLIFEAEAGTTYTWEVVPYPPYNVSRVKAKIYLSEVEEIDYDLGDEISVNKPVKLNITDDVPDYLSVQVNDTKNVKVTFNGMCHCGECFDYFTDTYSCHGGINIMSMWDEVYHYDMELDKEIYVPVQYNEIYLASRSATPIEVSINNTDTQKRTLNVGDLIREDNVGAYEYSVSVNDVGDYRFIRETGDGEFSAYVLYEVTTDEAGREVRTVVEENYATLSDIILSEDKKHREESGFTLNKDSQYIISVWGDAGHVIGLEPDYKRPIFDYDEYTAFIASGGTVSYVPYEDVDYEEHYWGGTDYTDDGAIYYDSRIGKKLIINTKNFTDRDNVWWPKPLSGRVGYTQNYGTWAIAPDEVSYQYLATRIERTYRDYAANRYVYNYVYTDAFYTVDEDMITAVNMEESIGDETILLAKRTPRLVYVDKIILDVPTVIKSGDTVKINVTLDTATPFEATNKGVTFKSSDTSVLKVDAEGNVTALKAGKATITVKSADGNAKKKVTITVTKQTYTIGYELNGGTNNTANPASYVGGKTITLQTPTKKGYTFEGWYTDPDFAEETQIIKLTKGNYVVYAKWSENHYDIAFNGNHATVEGEMESINGIGYDDVVTLSENSFEREGYTFKSWNTKADGSGTSYADGAEVSKLNKNDGKTVTLYAIWTKDKYTISYVMGEGASNSANNPMNYTVTTKTITLAAPTKKGYTFGGWYTDADCEEEVVTTITKGSTGNVTLYAKWTENQYNIAFNSNHAKATGEMETMTGIGYDDPATLSENGFEREGYTFKSWNTKADGSGKSYADGAEVSKLAAKDGKTVTLYAIWQKEKYTITYELDGGTNNTANPANYTVTSKTITLAAPTKKGYTFGGWYTDAECEEAMTTILKGSTGNVTLYAKWTENEYTIAFNSNHAKATGEMESISGIGYDDPVTLTENGFTRTGYTFKGWNTKADGSGKSYADGAEVSKLAAKDGKTVTLYAIWTKDKYTITYELDGGTNNTANPATYTVTTKTITLAAPTKKGYTFGGWYTDAECEETMTTILKGSTGNVTLYAKWTENEYTIAFNKNHAKATGEMESISGIGYDDPVTLSENGFEREGYTFKSWNTKADGSGKSYADGAEVSKLAAKDGKTVTLYAIWQKEKYTITYVVEDGTNNANNPATYTITTTTITLKKPKYTGDGFNPTFGGWYTSPDFEEDTKVTTIPKGSTGNKTLYARWIFG